MHGMVSLFVVCTTPLRVYKHGTTCVSNFIACNKYSAKKKMCWTFCWTRPLWLILVKDHLLLVTARSSHFGWSLMGSLTVSHVLNALLYLNPLSPKIQIQILQTDLHTLLLRIVERIWFKIKVFSLWTNQFSNSHNLYTWWSADAVRRKLMLVTLGT